MHGGAIKKVKDAAETRFKEELGPSIKRLAEIRDQSDHMPSALGATQVFLNRALGKQGAPAEDGGAKRVKVVVGVAIGGLPQKVIAAQAKVDAEEDAIEVELAETE